MLSILKRSNQDSSGLEIKKRKSLGYSIADKLWVMKNFAEIEGEKLSVDDILHQYYIDHKDDKENGKEESRKLSANSLGRIVSDLWKGRVRTAHLGKRGQRKKMYVNVGKLSVALDVDRVDIDLSSLALNNFTKITTSNTSISFVRLESWAFDDQRMMTELKVSVDNSDVTIEIRSQGRVLNIVSDSELGREISGLNMQQSLEVLEKFLDDEDNGMCFGFAIPEDQEGIALSADHKIVKVEHLDISGPAERRVFSGKCRLFSPKGQCCSSCSLLRKRENQKQKRISSRENIAPKCNERWLSKDQLKEKICNLRKEKKNFSAKEIRMKEKFEAQLLQMDARDSTDLESIMGMVDGEDVPANMQILWEQQQKIMQTKSKYGYRWHPKIIQLCLDLYCKNPHVLDSIREVIYLPSNKTIKFHKNKREEKPGWQWDIVNWCLEKAKEENLKDSDYWGGLVIDEMKVQENVEMVIKRNSEGNVEHRLVGFVQLGSLHEDMRKLEGKSPDTVELATHVLQFMFLSDSGFRFPIAQFPSHDLTPSDLYDIFWQGVLMMLEYNFTIYWCILDGADVNRKFIQLHFPNGDPTPQKFTAMNSYTLAPMIFMMDSKHNIKKIRNNLQKSNKSVKPRCLTVANKQILWSHLRDAYHFDQTETSIHIHEKLTEDHFNLDPAAKMRNHLAEEVLDQRMLYLMKAYKRHLTECGKNGSQLDACVEFLEHTSRIIELFCTSKQAITSANDIRIKHLDTFLTYMSKWNESVKDGKEFISSKLWFDLQSMVLGFKAIVSTKLAHFPSCQIKAWIINQDVVENHFCNVRACNGQNNNPSYRLQESTQNSIRYGQKTISKKCNARVSSK